MGLSDRLLRELSLSEGINDKYIFKAVIMAGAGGSGKSFVVDTVIGKKGPVSGLGAIIINSDDFFEAGLAKAGLPFVVDATDVVTYAKQMEIRNIAKKLSSSKLKNILNGMLPVVLDGTERDAAKILNQKKALNNLGYDVAMIFVNTSIDIAKERNQKRKRTVPEPELIKAWKSVQKNLGKFSSEFGRNFYIIDNNDVLEGKALMAFRSRLFKIGKKFFESSLRNPVGLNTLKVMRLLNVKLLSEIGLDRALDAVGKAKGTES